MVLTRPQFLVQLPQKSDQGSRTAEHSLLTLDCISDSNLTETPVGALPNAVIPPQRPVDPLATPWLGLADRLHPARLLLSAPAVSLFFVPPTLLCFLSALAVSIPHFAGGPDSAPFNHVRFMQRGCFAASIFWHKHSGAWHWHGDIQHFSVSQFGLFTGRRRQLAAALCPQARVSPRHGRAQVRTTRQRQVRLVPCLLRAAARLVDTAHRSLLEFSMG